MNTTTTKTTAPLRSSAWVLRPGSVQSAQALLWTDPAHFARAVAGGRGPLCLAVSAGAVWVTWPGCGDDHFVQAGQWLALPAQLDGVLLESDPRQGAPAARLQLFAPAQQALRPAPGATGIDCAPLCPSSPPPTPRFFPLLTRCRQTLQRLWPGRLPA